MGVGSASRSGDEGSSYQRRHCYDVFLSFRGEDTHKGFIRLLLEALDQVGVKAFADSEESSPGEEILDTQIEAIGSCRIAVVVFSQNYANSRRCLYEVTKIVERMKKEGLTALPIFYDVDPNDVCNQTGPYAEAFVQHELNCKHEVERWRVALKEESSFSGYMVTPDKAELVLKYIVRHVLSALNYTLFQSPASLVGMKSHLAAVDSLLNPKTKDVQMVAICGMEGIGKTTIAMTFCKKNALLFKYRAILENVKETCGESSQNGLLKLQRRLLSQIGKEEEKIWDVDQGADMIKQNCRDLELLLVIDDVNDAVQLEKLAGAYDWFGPSSIIIVTTRDTSVLHNFEEMKLYEVLPLKATDAYRLFKSKAFQDNDNTESYEGIVNAALEIAQGIPLAISVLGGLFHSKPKNEWESTLEVLKSCPPHEIVDNDSCCNLTELLLLLHGLQRSKIDELVLRPRSHRSLVVKSCGNLVDLPPILKSLEVSNCTMIAELPSLPHSLQSLVVEMCANLAELPPLPPSLQNLGVSECDELAKLPQLPPTLQNLHVSKCRELAELPPLPPSLQSLEVSKCDELAKLPQLPPTLQNLHVSKCRELAELPPLPPSLRSLEISGRDELAKLPQLLPSLQNLHVSKCGELAKLPPLPPSLQSLEVSCCDELAKLPPLPPSLQSLEVSCCDELAKLPPLPPSLQSLEVSCCDELAKLPPLPPSLQSLEVSCCDELAKLPTLPPSLRSLEVLRCKKLAELPPLPPSLQGLEVSMCDELAMLPQFPPSLQDLDISVCRELVGLPPLSLSLRSLYVSCCDNLAKLPQLPPSLQNLHVSECREPAELPSLPPSLQSLRVSRFYELAKLPQLPPSLQNLHVSECEELAELPPLPLSLQSLEVHWCGELAKLPQLPPSLQNLHFSENRELAEFAPLPLSLRSLNVSMCDELAKLPQLPPSLQNLYVSKCSELAELPSLPPSLRRLEVSWCHNLAKLPLLPPSLESLEVSRCNKLAELPTLPPCLERLHVSMCGESAKLPPLPLSLRSLIVWGCQLVELPPFPPSLKRFVVYQCNELIKLPPLPQSLKRLAIRHCCNLAELPPLPPSLEESNVPWWSESAKHPPFPPNVQMPDVCDCMMDVTERLHFSETLLLPPSLLKSHGDGYISLVEFLSSTPRIETPEPPLPHNFQSLFWSSCWSVSKCPQSLVRMEILKELSLDRTAIDELPPSIENLVGLKKLCLQKCKNIKTLPNSIYRLRSLQRVSLDGCSKVVEFPKYADVSTSCPSTQKPLSFPKWTYMDLRGCRLREINFINDLDCSSTLKNFDLSGNKLVTIPECISKLTALQQLNLENCKQLREILGLPPNLKYLFAKGCESLEWYVPLSRMLKSHPINSPRFRQIDFSGCDKLSQGESSLANFFSIEDLIVDSQIRVLHPGSEIPKWFDYKSLEGSISFYVDSESYQNIAGLAFCMVIGLEGHEHNEVSFSCQIEVHINNQRTYGYMDFFNSVGSDHMWLMYVPSPIICGWDTHMQRGRNEFMVLLESSKDTLRCCGVHPILKKDRQAIRRTNLFDTSDGDRPKKRIRLI